MNHDDMAGMMAGNPDGQAEMDMHQKMMAAKQGDASEMWTRKMIEHHRGGIAMSRIVLQLWRRLTKLSNAMTVWPCPRCSILPMIIRTI